MEAASGDKRDLAVRWRREEEESEKQEEEGRIRCLSVYCNYSYTSRSQRLSNYLSCCVHICEKDTTAAGALTIRCPVNHLSAVCGGHACISLIHLLLECLV